jgi:hypothetical protein
MKTLRFVAFVAALAAASCACPDKNKGTTPGGGGGGGDGSGAGADAAPTQPAAPDAGAGPSTGLPDKPGMPCDDRGCAAPFTCLAYYGIAGPRGPQFRTCEIPCPTAESTCPPDLKCTTIADGPGPVCR